MRKHDPLTRPGDLPYSDVDRGAPAEARISDSDTTWELWQEANKPPPDTNFMATQPASIPMPLPKGDPRYATTVPAALTSPHQPQAKPVRAARQISLTEVMNEARRNNRVCPQPAAWQKLYEMLPGKRQIGRGWEPPPPLTGSAWSVTPALAKRMCLRDHIEWAERQGCLDEVFAFIKALPETDWHYM